MIYAIRFMRKNILSSLLQIVQLTVVLIVVVFMTSTVNYRKLYYSPIKDAVDSDGIIVNLSNSESLTFESDIKKTFPDLTKITGVLSTNLFNNEIEYDVLAYSSQFINNVYMRLDSGSISKLNDTENNYCLISSNQGYKTGDEITFSLEEKEVKFIVAGVITDNQLLFGKYPEIESQFYNDYRDFYSVYSSSTCKPLIITSEKCLDKLGLKGVYSDQVIINFPEGYDKEKVIQKLSENWAMYRFDTSELKNNSKDYIWGEVYVILPIIICVLLLTIFTSVSSNAISAKRNLKNYGVMYLCGATWKKCTKVSMINSLIICVISSLLSLAILSIGKLTFWSDTVVTIGLWQSMLCLITLLIYIMISMLIPLLLVGNISPRDVLKSN